MGFSRACRAETAERPVWMPCWDCDSHLISMENQIKSSAHSKQVHDSQTLVNTGDPDLSYIHWKSNITEHKQPRWLLEGISSNFLTCLLDENSTQLFPNNQELVGNRTPNSSLGCRAWVKISSSKAQTQGFRKVDFSLFRGLAMGGRLWKANELRKAGKGT